VRRFNLHKLEGKFNRGNPVLRGDKNKIVVLSAENERARRSITGSKDPAIVDRAMGVSRHSPGNPESATERIPCGGWEKDRDAGPFDSAFKMTFIFYCYFFAHLHYCTTSVNDVA
jgi:hypothetical protein